jgi:type I restriction enzyme, R subunit
MNKKQLSERDICSKFIGPAIKRAGWDGMLQVREEVAFTKGRIIVRGKLVTRGKAKRADYILYYKPNIPIAIIEAKDNNHSVGDGMQHALDHATTLNIPFVFSSNGDGFVFHDRTVLSDQKEASLTLEQFPTPKDLWTKYRTWKGLTPNEEEIVLQDYYDDGSGKAPRYYQTNAINARTEAIADSGTREIDLCPTLAVMLKRYLEKCGEKLKSDLLFQSKPGKPLHQSNVLRRTLYPILQNLNQPTCGCHVLDCV